MNKSQRPWDVPECLPVSKLINPRFPAWAELAEDIQMRLEQTSNREGLRYLMDNQRAMNSAYASLKYQFERRIGKDQIVVGTRTQDGKCYLVCWRGSEYGKNTERDLD